MISGESGAGKTEAAKLFVRQLIHVSNGAEYEGLEKKLVQVFDEVTPPNSLRSTLFSRPLATQRLA